VLPRHIKVVITGITGQKSASVGLRGVVKKVVGLRGWHVPVSLASNWSRNPLEICFSVWFFILNVSTQVNNVSWLVFQKVGSQSFWFSRLRWQPK
jgi:hypothetical protein